MGTDELHRLVSQIDQRRHHIARAQRRRSALIYAYGLVGADLRIILERGPVTQRRSRHRTAGPV
jgi:hypothetical protein